jgi:hypothetical protein
MTTKVTITCQENSHWHLKVTAQELVRLDPDVHPQMPEDQLNYWKDVSYNPVVILGPGQSTENLYVHDSRRYIVEEVNR